MKFIKVLIILLYCFSLASCTALSRMLADAGAKVSDYKDVSAVNRKLVENPPKVDLSRYKAVGDGIVPHNKELSVAIAASGGGYRAANLTAGVLMGLEKLTDKNLKGNLLEEVDYFSTVSGSGFAVGYYMAQLNNYLYQYRNASRIPTFSFNNVMYNGKNPGVRALSVDYTAGLFFGDRRGNRLEAALDRNILATDAGDLKLGDIFVPKDSKRQAKLPYWITNATVFQNAANFPFTPAILAEYKVKDYTHLFRHYQLEADPSSPNYGLDMPAAVGMTASASFPFAAFGVTLSSGGCRGPCYLQLFDGGLSDNLGIFTALDLLQQDNKKIKLLIVIDAYHGGIEPFSKSKQPPRSLTLLAQVLNAGIDSSRHYLKANAKSIARNALCEAGAKNVLIVYLDLDNYPKARAIGTNLKITPEDQKLLISLGEQLVTNNPVLTEQLPELLAGDTSIGKCVQSKSWW